MTRRDLIFRVFVSSTFRDLMEERNALQKEESAFERLRKYCTERGARFQAIDLRWGVSAEAGLDQQTMSICFEELERCQEMSPKPNFIILLGERYGWRPLPARIPADEFEALGLHRIPLFVANKPVPPWRAGPPSVREGWYRKDENAVPPEYVLQPRTFDAAKEPARDDREKEEADWRRCEADMRKVIATAMDTLGWKPDDLRRRRYERSATHQEIDHGALDPRLDADKHVFAYFREITGAPTDGSAADYIDARPDADDLKSLKKQVADHLPAGHVYQYPAQWKNGAPQSDLDALCVRVFEDLKRVIDEELAAFRQKPDLERETESHREFAEARSRHFIGRQNILGRIKDYLADPADNLPLVIHGVSGCGKTALMAQAWLKLTDAKQSAARFIGATPGSADLRTLLRSLSEQLGIASPPTDMNELVKSFRERLAGPEKGGAEGAAPAPAVVFLDALDQLNPSDSARMLYWLPRALAPGVKLVVSALEAESPPEPGPRREDPFEIAGKIWPKRLVEVGALGANEGETLLGTWLDDAQRTLQNVQRRDVLDKFARSGRPLYLKVAFEEARRWHSWDPLPNGGAGLSDSVEGVLADMLTRLEHPRLHGRMLVDRALGGIAAAKNGLTEEELLDVLSAEPALMGDFFERNPASPTGITRLPVVIWSRLRADLRSYIADRRADGTTVMNFYHGQVGEAVRVRYLAKEEERLGAHVRLGDYFHGLDYWAETLEAQRARAKRLPPTPRPANVRKVVELPYHRLEAAKLGGKDDPKSKYWDTVADLLTDWQFLEAKTEADPNFREPDSKEPPPATDEAKP